MRISRRLILRTAERLLQERGEITQIELHDELERILGRQLTVNEKRRITMILRNEYVVDKIIRDTERGNQRIFIFM